MIAIDTNILVYAHRSGVPEHHAGQEALQAACNDPRGWGTAISSVAEFWAVVTHARAAGGASSKERAGGYLNSLVETGGMQVWVPGTSFATRLIELASDLVVSGVRIFDLQIALTAADNGATEIWTNDRNFISVPGLMVRLPLRAAGN